MSDYIVKAMSDLHSKVSFGGRGGGGGGGGGGARSTVTRRDAACGAMTAATTAMAMSPLTKNPYGLAATAGMAGLTAVVCM
jgi:hypothetical protein